MTQLVPYIFFYGRCEEALEFYKRALGGTFELQKVGDSPMRDDSPPETHNAVMHATFTAPGITFMASDGRERKTIDPDAGNVSLALNFAASDAAGAARVFAALAEGGESPMPFGDAPWGGKFGMVHDRFGNEWMVSAM
jgi:PhnB protein